MTGSDENELEDELKDMENPYGIKSSGVKTKTNFMQKIIYVKLEKALQANQDLITEEKAQEVLKALEERNYDKTLDSLYRFYVHFHLEAADQRATVFQDLADEIKLFQSLLKTEKRQ